MKHIVRTEAQNSTALCEAPIIKVTGHNNPEENVCGACVAVLVGSAKSRLNYGK